MPCHYTLFSKDIRLKDLSYSVQCCNLCKRMYDRTKVLSKANGNVNSKVLFIAEAPGRLGADKTGIPLYGDKSGDNFELLIEHIGWERKDIFVTNAILCNPRNEEGNNCTPTPKEIKNCNIYLEMTIDLVDPEVVITLGAIALEALKYISPHGVQLSKNVGKQVPWLGRMLVPLYHTGPRALIHRPFLKQKDDYSRLSQYVHPVKGINVEEKNPRNIEENDRMIQTIVTIIKLAGRISYFKLTKLLYFIDLFSIEQRGHSLTGSIYLRMQEGPWPPQFRDIIKQIDGYEVLFRAIRGGNYIVSPGPSNRIKIKLSNEDIRLIEGVLDKYVAMDNRSIKIAAYRTEPMKYVLEEERKGRDMNKVPIIYKNTIVVDEVKHV